MRKSPAPNVHIPDDVYRLLEAAAKAQGKTSSEIIVEILTRAFRDHPLAAYLKDGVFDERRFKADCQQTADALERWDRENWPTVARILRHGKKMRRQVPRPGGQ
jgi:uncharacterized protein (DUF1778 family)